MPYSAEIRAEAKLFEVPGHAVIATDSNGTIVYWGHDATELFGWREDEVLGKPVVMVTPSVDAAPQAEAIMEQLAKGVPWSGTFRLRRRDGSTFEAHVRDLPVTNGEGQLVGIIGVTNRIVN